MSENALLLRNTAEKFKLVSGSRKLLVLGIAFSLVTSVALAARITYVDRDFFFSGIDEYGEPDESLGTSKNRARIRFDTELEEAIVRIRGKVRNEYGSKIIFNDNYVLEKDLESGLEDISGGACFDVVESRLVVKRSGRFRLWAFALPCPIC